MKTVREQILRAVYQGIIDGGYAITVNYGDVDYDDYAVKESKNVDEIMAALYNGNGDPNVDEEDIEVTKDGKHAGFVRLNYCNEDDEMIHDHSASLEPCLQKAETLIGLYA